MVTDRKASASEGIEEIATARIELLDTEPAIWREVEVPTAISLKMLHDIVQCAMGWTDSHLWEFTVGHDRFGPSMPAEWGDERSADAAKARLHQILKPRKTVIEYLYDFGDS